MRPREHALVIGLEDPASYKEPEANKRADAYGGSIDNRIRFLLEVVTARANAREPSRVGVRISPWSSFNSMADSDPRALFTRVATLLRPVGLAYLHVVEDVAGAENADGERLTPRLREEFGGLVIANGGTAKGYTDYPVWTDSLAGA